MMSHARSARDEMTTKPDTTARKHSEEDGSAEEALEITFYTAVHEGPDGQRYSWGHTEVGSHGSGKEDSVPTQASLEELLLNRTRIRHKEEYHRQEAKKNTQPKEEQRGNRREEEHKREGGHTDQHSGQRPDQRSSHPGHQDDQYSDHRSDKRSSQHDDQHSGHHDDQHSGHHTDHPSGHHGDHHGDHHDDHQTDHQTDHHTNRHPRHKAGHDHPDGHEGAKGKWKAEPGEFDGRGETHPRQRKSDYSKGSEDESQSRPPTPENYAPEDTAAGALLTDISTEPAPGPKGARVKTTQECRVLTPRHPRHFGGKRRQRKQSGKGWGESSPASLEKSPDIVVESHETSTDPGDQQRQCSQPTTGVSKGSPSEGRTQQSILMWLNSSAKNEGASTLAARTPRNDRSTNTEAQPPTGQMQLDSPAVEDSEEDEFVSVIGDLIPEGSTGTVSTSVWDGRHAAPLELRAPNRDRGTQDLMVWPTPIPPRGQRRSTLRLGHVLYQHREDNKMG